MEVYLCYQCTDFLRGYALSRAKGDSADFERDPHLKGNDELYVDLCDRCARDRFYEEFPGDDSPTY